MPPCLLRRSRLCLQIQLEIYHEGTPEGSGPGAHPAALGAAGRLARGQRAFRVRLRLAFPGAKAADCSSRARELLRSGVAVAAGVDVSGVSIDRIAAPNAARGQPHLAVHLGVLVGPDLLKAAGLARAITGRSSGGSGGTAGGGASGSTAQQVAGSEPLAVDEAAAEAQAAAAAGAAAEVLAAPPSPEQLSELLGGEPLMAALGLPDPAQCAAEIEDVTPACAVSEAERAQQAAVDRGEEGVQPQQDRRLAHVSGCHCCPAPGLAERLLRHVDACMLGHAPRPAPLTACYVLQPVLPTCMPACHALPAARPPQNRAGAAL